MNLDARHEITVSHLSRQAHAFAFVCWRVGVLPEAGEVGGQRQDPLTVVVIEVGVGLSLMFVVVPGGGVEGAGLVVPFRFEGGGAETVVGVDAQVASLGQFGFVARSVLATEYAGSSSEQRSGPAGGSPFGRRQAVGSTRQTPGGGQAAPRQSARWFDPGGSAQFWRTWVTMPVTASTPTLYLVAPLRTKIQYQRHLPPLRFVL